MHNKTELRRTLLLERKAINPEKKRHMDAAIGLHAKQLLKQYSASIVGVYWPIQGEPDLMSLYEDLAREGIKLSLPKVEQKDSPLRFVEWIPGEPLVKGAYGIMVPDGIETAVQPDVLLAPCVAFSAQRMRVGFGTGYYDRTLATLPRPVTIGIAYSFTKAEFEAAPHDIPLDAIVTETACF